MLRAECPEPSQGQPRHTGRLTQLIRVLGARSDLVHPDRLEALILDIARGCSTPEKGFLKRLKKTETPDATGILLTVFQALGNIGGAASEAFLAGVAKGKSAQAKAAGDALVAIRNRSAPEAG